MRWRQLLEIPQENQKGRLLGPNPKPDSVIPNRSRDHADFANDPRIKVQCVLWAPAPGQRLGDDPEGSMDRGAGDLPFEGEGGRKFAVGVAYSTRRLCSANICMQARMQNVPNVNRKV